jgi:polysaccharide biosynthesis/export protein
LFEFEPMVMRKLLGSLPHGAIGLAFAVALLPACSNTVGSPPGPNFATGTDALTRIYRLGIGDKLKISVFGEESLSGPVEIDAFGRVSLPLAGDVPAKGLSIIQFRDAVAKKLSDGYLKNPRVTVEVTNYRGIYIHGEVKTGGEFPFKPGLTLRDAVALAGGYTYRADQSLMLIQREGDGVVRIPLPTDVPVLPGDNLQVPERFF